MIDFQQKLDLCLQAGEMLLKNGAGTSRVVETMEHIAIALELGDLHTLVIPSGIILTVDQNDRSLTKMVRIGEPAINLNRIHKINAVSRQLCTGSFDFALAKSLLDGIAQERNNFSHRVAMVATGVVGGAFALLQQAPWVNALPAFVTAMLVRMMAHYVVRRGGVRFVFEFLGGLLAAGMGLLIPHIGHGFQRDVIIIGGIIPLVPGMTVISAIQDLIAGELLSGVLRGMEALTTFLTIAMGVMLMLAFGLGWQPL